MTSRRKVPVPCKRCGKLTINHVFCNRACSKAWYPVKKKRKCKNCGELTLNKAYCDPACRREYVKKGMTNCNFCGKPTKNQKYCSQSCKNSQHEVNKLEGSFLPCPVCHKKTFKPLEHPNAVYMDDDGVCRNPNCTYTGFIDKDRSVKYMHVSHAEI